MTRNPWHNSLPVTLAVIVSGLPATQSRASDEEALWKLWQQHSREPDQHTAVIAACRQFVAQDSADELVPVAQGIEAWRLLKTDRRKEAFALLESHLARGNDATHQGAAELARAWLSLFDIDTVRNALQLYYRKEVRYPNKLAALTDHPGIPADRQPRLVDRWDTPWEYKLTGFASMPGFRDQRYTLSCKKLGSISDSATALALPYGAGISARPVRVVLSQDAGAVVEFTGQSGGDSRGGRLLLGTGRRSGDLFLAYVGEALIVVCDQVHWKVIPKPR